MKSALKLILGLCLLSGLFGCLPRYEFKLPAIGSPGLPTQDLSPTLKAVGKIEVDTNGAPLKMSYKDAYQYCHNLGSRLPTIREFALVALLNNAKGIRETTYPDVSIKDPKVVAESNANSADGYYAEYRRSSSGIKVIAFYLNQSGQGNSQIFNALDNGHFWSSPTPCGEDDSNGAYVASRYGFICKDLRDYGKASVRCVVAK
jgi:hypothetical protein